MKKVVIIIIILSIFIILPQEGKSAIPLNIDIQIGTNLLIEKIYFENHSGATYGGSNILGRVKLNYLPQKSLFIPFLNIDYGNPFGVDIGDVGSSTIATKQLFVATGIEKGFNVGYSRINFVFALGYNWKTTLLKHPSIGAFSYKYNKFVPLIGIELVSSFMKNINLKITYNVIYDSSKAKEDSRETIDYRIEHAQLTHKLLFGFSFGSNPHKI